MAFFASALIVRVVPTTGVFRGGADLRIRTSQCVSPSQCRQILGNSLLFQCEDFVAVFSLRRRYVCICTNAREPADICAQFGPDWLKTEMILAKRRPKGRRFSTQFIPINQLICALPAGDFLQRWRWTTGRPAWTELHAMCPPADQSSSQDKESQKLGSVFSRATGTLR